MEESDRVVGRQGIYWHINSVRICPSAGVSIDAHASPTEGRHSHFVQTLEAGNLHEVPLEELFWREEVLLRSGEHDVLDLSRLGGVAVGVGLASRRGVEEGELAEEGLEAVLFIFPVDLDADADEDFEAAAA